MVKQAGRSVRLANYGYIAKDIMQRHVGAEALGLPSPAPALIADALEDAFEAGRASGRTTHKVDPFPYVRWKELPLNSQRDLETIGITLISRHRPPALFSMPMFEWHNNERSWLILYKRFSGARKYRAESALQPLLDFELLYKKNQEPGSLYLTWCGIFTFLKYAERQRQLSELLPVWYRSLSASL